MSFSSDPVDVKASKTHRCHWCGENIEKGEVYARWFCSESSSTIKVHQECMEAWGKVSSLTPDDEMWYEVPGDYDYGEKGYAVGPGLHPRGGILH